jgi:ATP-dependent Clp protease ATP-binding subunit ClpA
MLRGIQGVLVFAAVTLAIGFSSHADSARARKTFSQQFTEFCDAQAKSGVTQLATVKTLTDILSDQEMEAQKANERNEVLFRDDEVDRVFDILLRDKGNFALIVGASGSGKSSVSSEFAYRIGKHILPETNAYREAFSNAVVVRANLRNFLPDGGQMDLKVYLGQLRDMQTPLDKKVLIVLTESQFLNDYMVSVLREAAEMRNPVGIVLEVDQKSFGDSIQKHPSFMSIVEPIMVPDLKADQIKVLLKNYSENILAPKFGVKMTDEVYSALVDIAPDYRRDVAEPRRSLTLLQDFTIKQHRENAGTDVSPSRVELYRYAAKQAKMPVIPQNEKEFAEFMEGVKNRIKERVIGQNHIVDRIVDLFTAAMQSRSRQHRVAMLLGPTGVGKTLIGEILAEEVYGDKSRFLEIDMTQYKSTSDLSGLFGAANGLVTSTDQKGALCDFFDGPGKGGGIVVMNEVEEMSTEALTRFMELFDKGKFRGGDGRERFIGKTLFMMTSNKNSDKILAADAVRGMLRSELDRRLALITQEQLKKAFTEKGSYSEDKSKTVKPAVMERVDEILYASPLLSEDAVKVAQIEIDKYLKDFHQQSETKVTVDGSVAEIITSAFYNETLGSRQVRTNVQKSLSQAVNLFKKKYGYDPMRITISAKQHPALKTVSYITITSADGTNALTIDGPKVPQKNRLMDPEFRQTLLDL